MQSLSGKRILVTGASAGIGAATAQLLARDGAQVIAAARRRERLEALAKGCPGLEVLELDVRDAAAVADAIGGLELDALVANAGLARGVETLDAGDPEDWAVMLDTNVKGLLHAVRAVLPGMKARGRGDVVLLGSVAGRQVYPGGGVYCATKHAVRAIYEGLRLDLAGAGLRFTTVDPGLVETEFSLVRFDGDAERAGKVYQGLQCLRPDDVADAIHWVLTRPAHVNVGELVLWPREQASTTVVQRR
jgi:3-hydroxy acid dehydrogenase / malonic semialdehyde reductase